MKTRKQTAPAPTTLVDSAMVRPWLRVPDKLVERPKMGFGVPIGDWLRGPLRDWAETLLAPKRIAREGLLNPKPIEALWRQHLAGANNWQYPLWTVLMFQAWRERWMA